MNATELLLIDLSSIAVPIWKMSGAEPDPDHASQQIVARVRNLAAGHVHVAVCCDSGRSFRHAIDAAYKANRPESEAPMHHQIALAKEQLAHDGFPIWSVKGFEADDLLASATVRGLAIDDAQVLIVSADKDLLAMVGQRVRVLSPITGNILDVEGVTTKFGVPPSAICDYLTLVGDSSDNIKGAKGIGAKTAVDLLATWHTLDALYAALDQADADDLRPLGLTPAIAASLREFKSRCQNAASLIALRTDVELPFEEIAAERTPAVNESFDAFAKEQPMELDLVPDDTMKSTGSTVATDDVPVMQAALKAQLADAEKPKPAPKTELVKRFEGEPMPSTYERQLDPRSLRDAETLATYMFQSRIFAAYGNAPAILSTIILGRELGMPAMASLRGIHIVEGRHTLSAQTMVALVLKSGLAEYFEATEISETRVTYETQRKGGRRPMSLTHTIEMAQQAGLVKDKSNWVKTPTDMLCARCSSRLARLVYPDIVGGLYTPDELIESNDDRKTRVA